MRRSSPIFRVALTAATLAVAVLSSPMAQAQTTVLGGPVVRTSLGAARPPQDMLLPRGTSTKVDFGAGFVKSVVVSDPTIADVQSVTASTFVILAKQPGRTDVRYFDASGREVFSQNVQVQMDIMSLDSTLRRVVPNAQVHSEVIGQNIVLSGQVANAAENDLAVRVARTFVQKPENVVNALIITGKDLVRLDVRVVEVNRTVLKQLGFNTQVVLGQIGGNQITIGNAPTYAINGGFQGQAIGGWSLDTTKQPQLQVPCGAGTCYQHILPGQDNFFSDGSLIKNADTATARDVVGSDKLNKGNGLIQAFERQGLVRIIAEPNLTTVSGEGAKFLAGGEYPVPTGRDTTGNTIIEFKPYGVGLGFTPVVLSGGRISLKISVEVSELTTQGALTLQGVGGAGTTTVIPALQVRRAENVVELSSGGAAQIAGLLQSTTRQNIDKVPGVADLPVLGALARSRDFLNNETELVILVNAFVVDQVRPDQLQTPADGLRIASDAETVLMGRLNSPYKGTGKVDATTAAAPPPRSYEGPIGHVIE